MDSRTLDIEIKGPLQSQRLHWDREQVRAVQTFPDLRILTDAKMTSLFAERDRREVKWLADLLRQVLGVRDQMPLDPDEIRVMMSSIAWQKDYHGILQVIPGEMSLRNARGPSPAWRFTFREAYQPGTTTKRLPIPVIVKELQPANIRCRLRRDGITCMMITIPGVDHAIEVQHADREVLEQALARFLGPCAEQ